MKSLISCFHWPPAASGGLLKTFFFFIIQYIPHLDLKCEEKKSTIETLWPNLYFDMPLHSSGEEVGGDVEETDLLLILFGNERWEEGWKKSGPALS